MLNQSDRWYMYKGWALFGTHATKWGVGVSARNNNELMNIIDQHEKDKAQWLAEFQERNERVNKACSN